MAPDGPRPGIADVIVDRQIVDGVGGHAIVFDEIEERSAGVYRERFVIVRVRREETERQYLVGADGSFG